MLAATTQIQSDHSLCLNMNSTLFWVALRVGHGDLVPGFAWSLAGCFLALGWSAPSLLPCCIGQFGPCWEVQSAYREFTELILFGITVHLGHNSDCKSCRTRLFVCLLDCSHIHEIVSLLATDASCSWSRAACVCWCWGSPMLKVTDYGSFCFYSFLAHILIHASN